MPEVGVPSTGVVKDGDVDKTTEPEPVDEVTPVPPLATAKVAESPAALPVMLIPHEPDAAACTYPVKVLML